MTAGFQQVADDRRKRRGGSGFIVRTALILSILAAVLIFFVVLTISSSNHLMSIEKTSVSNVPSNILPSYSTCSFESFDGQTNLSGWFFKCDNPITTVIVVHNAGSNRLPFGVNMVDLVENLLDNNYNVFLFDQRNSGESEGDVCNYGYLEWQDVIGAIAQVRSISVTTNVVLYGIGTGCTSTMLAYDKLPESGLTESELKRMITESVRRVLNEEHGGTYIQGVLNAIEDAIYSTVDTEIARMAIGDRANMMKQTLARFVTETFSDACELQRKTDALDSKIIDTPPSGTFW